MKNTIILVAISLFVLSTAVELQHLLQQFDYKEPANVRQLYEDFKRKYGKEHANEDDHYRFGVFRENLKLASLYQSMEQGTAEYGITKFSDMTVEEFAQQYLTLAPYLGLDATQKVVTDLTFDIPPRWDWRQKGAVTRVRDQQKCGASWAFSTIGTIEGQWFLRKGQLVELSDQQLIDCDKKNSGCKKGSPTTAYNVIRGWRGIANSTDYPYVGKQQSQCQMDGHKVVAFANYSMSLDSDEDQIASYMARFGPVSMVMNGYLLQFYKNGISHPNWILCPASFSNCAVLGVGFDKEDNTPYWIVKNSWGQDWGEQGYFRMYRGDGTCGINQEVTCAVIF